jgi:hypothetical protein
VHYAGPLQTMLERSLRDEIALAERIAEDEE